MLKMNESAEILVDAMSEQTAAATQKDKITFDEAFMLHHRTVFRAARSIVRDAGLAEDVTHRTAGDLGSRALDQCEERAVGPQDQPLVRAGVKLVVRADRELRTPVNGKTEDRIITILKDAIREADALLIAAGAGMGVDSGRPDFRGTQGFWKAYPPFAALGLRPAAHTSGLGDHVETDATGCGWVDVDVTLSVGDKPCTTCAVRSAVPGGGYETLSGTSRAAPHVAGAVALMWSAAPSLVADMRLGVCLEHERREGRAVVRVDLDGVIALRALERMDLLHVEGVGHQLDDALGGIRCWWRGNASLAGGLRTVLA